MPRRAEGPGCTMADAAGTFTLPMDPSLYAPLALQETRGNAGQRVHGFTQP